MIVFTEGRYRPATVIPERLKTRSGAVRPNSNGSAHTFRVVSEWGGAAKFMLPYEASLPSLGRFQRRPSGVPGGSVRPNEENKVSPMNERGVAPAHFHRTTFSWDRRSVIDDMVRQCRIDRFVSLSWTILAIRKRRSFVTRFASGARSRSIRPPPSAAFSIRGGSGSDLPFIRAHAHLAPTFVDVGANCGLLSAELFDRFSRFCL